MALQVPDGNGQAMWGRLAVIRRLREGQGIGQELADLTWEDPPAVRRSADWRT